jgi:hypothetical protein
MHFHFDFSAGQILWTLTFAGLLVLLVVLLGRDRARRFPWFTAAMVMMALRMVASRLLGDRMPQITFSEIFLSLSDLASLIAIGVIVEIARRAFAAKNGARRAGRTGWIVAGVIVLGIGGVITAKWGPWPSWKTLMAGSELSALRIMQLFAQKTDLLADTLTIQLGLLVVLFGRRFGAGFRSHTQQIAIGLSTASCGQLLVRYIWQQIAMHTTIHTQAEYSRVMGMQEKFYNANNVVYLAALAWWIICLWIDEPGSVAAAPGAPAEIPAGAEANETESAGNSQDASAHESSSAEIDEVSHETKSVESSPTPPAAN